MADLFPKEKILKEIEEFTNFMEKGHGFGEVVIRYTNGKVVSMQKSIKDHHETVELGGGR